MSTVTLTIPTATCDKCGASADMRVVEVKHLDDGTYAAAFPMLPTGWVQMTGNKAWCATCVSANA